MIPYLDTSALVKRYVRERGSAEVESFFAAPESPPVLSRIAWVEATAALRRRSREGVLASGDLELLLQRLDRDLGECRVIEVSEEILRRSVRVLRSYPLRAYDAVHLGSALWMRERFDPDVRFVCADRTLARVATEAGLGSVIPGE